MPAEELIETELEPIDDSVVVDPAGEQTPPSPAEVGDLDFRTLTPREKALVEKARTQEKQKLYKDLKETKKALADAERREKERGQQPAAVTGNQTSEIQELRNLVVQMTERLEKRDREASVTAYRNQKLSKARSEGVRFIESLVMGDTEEDIDLSFEIACQEAAQFEADLRAEDARRNPPPPAATPAGGRKTVVVNANPRKPEGVPSTVSTGVSGDGSEDGTLTKDEVSRLCSIESIYDGTWAKNRTEVIKALRAGKIR